MTDILRFRQEDLRLKVNMLYDKDKLNLEAWSNFIDQLCGDRYYQVEAINTAIIYLASGRYQNIQDLAKENYESSPELQKKYRNYENFELELQLKNKLSANIDLATGTGKSYVIYGIAQIMLGLGLVDKVLVLCPSLTIESALIDKFTVLSSDQRLKNSIPASAIIKNPRIINANVTIKTGDICVENVHAVYTGTGSSINDSFSKNGEKVLVLNDESHHIFNKIVGGTSDESNLKKWKEFLLNSNFKFRYILGFTGTAYIVNEYFNDVIYRYSLRNAIEDRIVKNIEYVAKDDSIREEEKFQKIFQNHKYNQEKYSKIKPLTILVASNIKNAKILFNKIVSYITKIQNSSEEVAKTKVLIVTSHKDHASNVLALRDIDSSEVSFEWVVSVSMLTEGWDVKNVFQIVPWEDRAFNSKLLISQVLGRGLRVPNQYSSPQPKVIVFNHDSWSKNINSLILEVLEIEKRVYSKPTQGVREKFNFNLHNLNYFKEEFEVEHEGSNEVYNYSRIVSEGIKLESQVVDQVKETTFENVISGMTREQKYKVSQKTWHIDALVDKIFDEFEIRDWEGKVLQLGDQSYTKNELPDRSIICNLIRLSMSNVGIEGDDLIERNVLRVLNSFSTLLRKKSSSAVTRIQSFKIHEIFTNDIPSFSVGVSGLRRGSTIFYSNEWKSDIDEAEQQNIMSDLIDDGSLPRWSLKEVNIFDFKSPLNVVITNQEPERKFVEMLMKHENASLINSWIKSVDKGYYKIEYSWRKNNHQISNSFFNPDFFIKVEKEVTYIIVVEIKSDKDDCDDNKAKYKYAKEHFARLNDELVSQGINEKYIFHFLSPNGYIEFFEYLRSGTLLEDQSKFRCELELLIE